MRDRALPHTGITVGHAQGDSRNKRPRGVAYGSTDITGVRALGERGNTRQNQKWQDPKRHSFHLQSPDLRLCARVKRKGSSKSFGNSRSDITPTGSACIFASRARKKKVRLKETGTGWLVFPTSEIPAPSFSIF